MPRGAGTVTRPLDTLSLPSSGLLDHERSLVAGLTASVRAVSDYRPIRAQTSESPIVQTRGVGEVVVSTKPLCSTPRHSPPAA